MYIYERAQRVPTDLQGSGERKYEEAQRQVGTGQGHDEAVGRCGAEAPASQHGQDDEHVAQDNQQHDERQRDSQQQGRGRRGCRPTPRHAGHTDKGRVKLQLKERMNCQGKGVAAGIKLDNKISTTKQANAVENMTSFFGGG